jgi:hypothetical protein
MVGIFGDRWYGELQWNNIPEQHDLNECIIQMHEEFDIPLISTADSHYPNRDAWKDRELYKRLGWLGKGKPDWADGQSFLGALKRLATNSIPRTAMRCLNPTSRYSDGRSGI